MTTFVNGNQVAVGAGPGNLNTTSSLKFGRRGSPDPRGFFLNGRIDEVELFVGRALSNSEIAAIYNAGSAGKCKERPVGGSVTGVSPSRVVCINVTRRQTVQIQD